MRFTTSRSSKKLMLWIDSFFRREKYGIRIVPPLGKHAELFTSFHDYTAHCNVRPTIKLLKDRLWCPGFYRGLTDYVSSCEGFQYTKRLPKYHKGQRAQVTGFFETFFIAFAHPENFRADRRGTSDGKAYGKCNRGFDSEYRCTIHPAGDNYYFRTAQEDCFRQLHRLHGRFSARSVQDYMQGEGLDMKAVLSYAPMANRRS